MAGQHGRRPGRLGGGLAGQREQGRAGDPQMTGRLAGLAEPGGQVVDHGAGLLGLAGQGLLACVDLVQQQPARVLSGHSKNRQFAASLLFLVSPVHWHLSTLVTRSLPAFSSLVSSS
jgi:hypothetical protein